MNTRIEPIELTADSPRELTDTELDAVSGGAAAAGAGAASGGAAGAVAGAATGAGGQILDVNYSNGVRFAHADQFGPSGFGAASDSGF